MKPGKTPDSLSNPEPKKTNIGFFFFDWATIFNSLEVSIGGNFAALSFHLQLSTDFLFISDPQVLALAGQNKIYLITSLLKSIHLSKDVQ